MICKATDYQEWSPAHEKTIWADLDGGCGLARVRAHRLDLLDDIHALNNLAENDVLAVQPGGDLGSRCHYRAIGTQGRTHTTVVMKN